MWSTARRHTTRRSLPNDRLEPQRPITRCHHGRDDRDEVRRRPSALSSRSRNPRARFARKAGRRHHPRRVPGLARSSCHRLSRPKPVARGSDPRDRVFWRTRRAVPAGEIFSQGLFAPAARHHVDLQHPRERRADRRLAGRGDEFHHDMIHAEVPSKSTLLYSVEIPSTGGNTLFASGYAAYDTLDPAIRDRLEGRKALHHYNYGSTQKGDSRGTAAFAECIHPAFRTHEDTGRKAVYVNRLMTVGVVGMPPAESEPLLDAVPPRSARSSTSTSGASA